MEEHPDQEILQIRATIILSVLEQFCQPKMLYTETELYDELKARGIDGLLKGAGYPALHPRREGLTTGMRHMLRNLASRGLIRKFALGTYVQSGRPFGVVWMVKW